MPTYRITFIAEVGVDEGSWSSTDLVNKGHDHATVHAKAAELHNQQWPDLDRPYYQGIWDQGKAALDSFKANPAAAYAILPVEYGWLVITC